MELIYLIILSLLYFMLFISTFWVIAFIDNSSIIWKDPKPKRKYFISVLVPAYNEEKTIKKTIESLLAVNYPKNMYEIIVINDGSTDGTKKVCMEYVKKGKIRLINKRNGGKASALNRGIKVAKGELIYVLDSDSFVDKDTFNSLIGYFNDPKVAAVTSSMRASSKLTFAQKIQWVEYFFSIFMRKVMSFFNLLYVTPGPGSIYRKNVIEEVGGFNENTLTEDMEIAFNIQDHGYKIENSLNSIVYTNTPSKVSDLVKQRRRWYVGFIEDSASYKHFYFNKARGLLGTFLLPLNIVSIFSLIFLTSYSLLKSFDSVISNLSNYAAVNFDLFPMFKNFDPSLFWFSISLFSVLGIMFLFYSIMVIYFSMRASKQKIDLKNNLLVYLYYILFYSFLMSFFWTDSIVYKLLFRRTKEGWKYGKTQS